jgi:hypothetical protein
LDQHAHSLTESFNLGPHFRELSFEFASALRNYDAAFKQYGPQLIDQRRPFPYQSITRPMTSTSAEPRPSFCNEKGSNATPLNCDDCNIS